MNKWFNQIKIGSHLISMSDVPTFPSEGVRVNSKLVIQRGEFNGFSPNYGQQWVRIIHCHNHDVVAVPLVLNTSLFEHRNSTSDVVIYKITKVNPREEIGKKIKARIELKGKVLDLTNHLLPYLSLEDLIG